METTTVLDYIDSRIKSTSKLLAGVDRLKEPKTWHRILGELDGISKVKEDILRNLQLEEDVKRLQQIPKWHWSRNLDKAEQ